MFLSSPILFIAVLLLIDAVHVEGVFTLVSGLLLVSLGLVAVFVRRSPRVRLRVSDKGLWLMPDRSNWFLLAKSVQDPVTVNWPDITEIDDGGVWYGYRKLRFSTESSSYQLNTTFLDCDLRSIVSVIDQQLMKMGKQLVEQRLGMSARSGKWRVTTDKRTPI